MSNNNFILLYFKIFNGDEGENGGENEGLNNREKDDII